MRGCCGAKAPYMVEVLQATLTTCRSGDWLDFLADTFGVLLALAAGIPTYRFLVR